MTVERMLPLYEAKMIHQFDHRWATYGADGKVRDATLEEKQDPNFQALPRYWVREEVVDDRISGRWEREWLLGWRDICRSTDERTMIAAINGAGASPEGGTLLAMPDREMGSLALLAIWNSFVFDFVSRQKVGGTHLKYFTMRQLPTPCPEMLDGHVPWQPDLAWHEWLSVRAGVLVLDAVDMQPLGDDLALCAADEPWEPRFRERVRGELDAGCFHLFGVNRDDADYILGAFPIVKRKDEAKFGTFRTKDLILEIYDQMQRAIDVGEEYEPRWGKDE